MTDVFPQPLKFQTQLPEIGDDLGIEIRFPLVLPRKESTNARIVTEIVSIKYDVGVAIEALAASGGGLRVALGYRALTPIENNPTAALSSIGDVSIIDVLAFKGSYASSVGFNCYASIYEHNLTGGTGFGYLIPGDRVFLNISTDHSLHTQKLGLVIFYRQRLVGLNEYLGILAGFQQNPS